MFSDAFRHYADTRLSFIYIYTMSDAQDWIVPFHHFDCVNQSNDLLQHLTSSKVIYALGRKRLMAYYPYRTVDADMVHWWQTGKPLPLDDSNTACHNAWGAWWSGTTAEHFSSMNLSPLQPFMPLNSPDFRLTGQCLNSISLQPDLLRHSVNTICTLPQAGHPTSMEE